MIITSSEDLRAVEIACILASKQCKVEIDTCKSVLDRLSPENDLLIIIEHNAKMLLRYEKLAAAAASQQNINAVHEKANS